MNEEKYILAAFKRIALKKIAEAEDYSTNREIWTEALKALAAIEAESVLGEEEEPEKNEKVEK